MTEAVMKNLVKLVNFVISNFGPLIGFYVINQFWGFKAGVLASGALVFIEYFWLKSKKQKIGTFFYFSSGMILIFGGMDLYLQEPYFMKYEASITNLLFAIFFGMSIFKDKSIVQEFAETQGRTSSETSGDKSFFFKMFTVAWTLYFLMKAFFYLWLSFNTSMSEGLVVRMFVGKVSFWLMMLLSIGFPKKIWNLMERLRLFPSQRASNSIQPANI